MAIRFLKIAVIYLQVGVASGLIMGLTHHFEYAPVHAHLNLLGWASLGLAGLVYRLYPEAEATRLAQVHFWLHNLGLPPFMVSLFALRAGHASVEPMVGIAAAIVFLGILAFVINVLRSIGSGAAANPRQVRFLPSLPISEWK